MKTYQNIYLKRSWLFKMHPLLKFLMFLCLTISVFLPNGFLGLICITFFTILLYCLSFLNWKSFIKTFCWLVVWMFLLFIIDWFTYQQSDATTSFSVNYNLWGTLSGKYTIENGSIIYSLYAYGSAWYQLNIFTIVIVVYIFWKLFDIFLLIQIMIKTSSELALNNGFKMLLKPLNYLHINTSSLSLIFTLTLRFIPNLYHQYKDVCQIQIAKGALNGSFKWWKRLKVYATSFPPLFYLAFENASYLSESMVIKGYTLKNKDHLYFKYHLHYYDVILFILSFGLFIFLIYLIASHTMFAPFGIANSIILNNIN